MLIARRFLLKCQGASEFDLPEMIAASGFAIQGGTRREYIRVRIENTDAGSVLRNFGNQGSGVMSSLSWAHGLAEIEIGRDIQPGDPVKVILLP